MKFVKVGHGGERSGVRGGRDQFKWDDVKHDKFKENYLGHSIHASRPTFNDPKPNALWYMNDNNPSENTVELNRLKNLEQEMMMEALGLKPKTHNPHRALSKDDVVIMLKREPGAVADNDSKAEDATLGHGMSFSSVAKGKFAVAPEQLPGVNEAPPPQPTTSSSSAQSEYKQLSKVERRALPTHELARLKTAHKAAKKARKAEKRRAKKQRRTAASSSSSSSEHSAGDDAKHAPTSATAATTRRRHDSDDDADDKPRARVRHDSPVAAHSEARRRSRSPLSRRRSPPRRARHDSPQPVHDRRRHDSPESNRRRHDSPVRARRQHDSPEPARPRHEAFDASDSHRYQERFRDDARR